MKKVFLGGTCNGDTWRDELIPRLKSNSIPYFNPVVDDWNEAAQHREIHEKEFECPIHLYHITSKMKGVFSIAEVTESAVLGTYDVIFSVNTSGFDEAQIKSLEAVGRLISSYGHQVIFDVVNNYEVIVNKILNI